MSRRLIHRTTLKGTGRLRLVIDCGETLLFGTGAAVMFRLLRLASGYRWVFAAAAVAQCLMALRMAVEVMRDARRIATRRGREK